MSIWDSVKKFTRPYGEDEYDDYDDVTHISCPLGDGIAVVGERRPDRETGGNYWFVHAEDEIIANKKYNGLN